MTPDSEIRARLDRAFHPSCLALDRLVAVRQLRAHLDIPADEPESPEDQWWRVRQEQERMAERWSQILRQEAEAAQAPMA